MAARAGSGGPVSGPPLKQINPPGFADERHAGSASNVARRHEDGEIVGDVDRLAVLRSGATQVAPAVP